MIKVGIIGGAGYTAGELIRILLGHPEAEVAYIHSTSNAGKSITNVHKDLLGETDLVFSSEWGEHYRNAFVQKIGRIDTLCIQGNYDK